MTHTIEPKRNRKNGNVKNIYIAFACVILSRAISYIEIDAGTIIFVIQILLLIGATYFIITFWKDFRYNNIKKLQIAEEHFSIEYSVYLTKNIIKGKVEELTIEKKENKATLLLKEKVVANILFSEITDEDIRFFENRTQKQ